MDTTPRIVIFLVLCFAVFSNATSSFASPSAKSTRSTLTKSARTHSRTKTSAHSKSSSSAKSHASSKGIPASCAATAVTTFTASYTPPASTSTETTLSSILINGDDGYLTCGATSIYYETTSYETTVVETVTYTQSSTSTSIIPPDSSVTIPAPSGFTPVQDSLPNAQYVDCEGGYDPVDDACEATSSTAPQRRAAHRKETCTITTTSTAILPTPTVTVTSTIYTTLLVFPLEHTTYDYNSCTTYYADGGTATRSITTATQVEYQTITESVTTQPVTTTTVYAACAASNFADAINPFTDGQYHRLLSADTDDYPSLTDYNTQTPYDCCVLAFQGTGVAVWTYFPQGNGAGVCSLYNTTDGACGAQNADAYGVVVARDNGTLPTVIGNAACGEFSTSTLYTPPAMV